MKITVSVPGKKPSLQPFAVEALFCAAIPDAPAIADKTSEDIIVEY